MVSLGESVGIQASIGDRRYVLHIQWKDIWQNEMVMRGDHNGRPFTDLITACKEAEYWKGRGAEAVWVYEEVLKVT